MSGELLEVVAQSSASARQPESVTLPGSEPGLASAALPDIGQAVSLLEASPGAHLLLDRVGIVRSISEGAASLLGRAPGWCIGRDLFRDIVPALEVMGLGEEYRANDWELRKQLVREMEQSPADAKKSLSVDIRAWVAAGQKWGLMTLAAKGTADAERSRRERAERLAAVGELAAGVAHEINNPLASIKGFAQLLARDAVDSGQQQALEIISQECSRVANIIDGLLDFATQQRVVEWETVDLSAVAREVITLKRYSLETSGISIEVDLDEAVSLVRGEKGAFQRLVLILLNQMERSLAIHESRRRLCVRTRETNEGVVLYLSDNGAGVARDALPAFLDGAADPDMGLGPSTAKQIVIKHRGSIWIESAEGRGTTFTIRFPRAAVAPTPEPVVVAPPPPEPPATAAGPIRVLVADDEPMLRLALSMFLSRQGYEVEQAATADEAFDLAATGGFDAALIDVKMPGDGLHLIDRLKVLDAWTGRAIIMTGDHIESQSRSGGPNSSPYLTKPFDMMDAVRLIDSLVNGSRDAREGSVE